MRFQRLPLVGSLALVLTIAVNSAANAKEAGLEFFEKNIQPVLAEHCYKCHSQQALAAKKLKAELLLDSRAGMHRGGESGPAVVPGNVEESSLISALRYEDFEMPPRGKLSAEVVANFVKWIEMGAPDPRDGELPSLPAEHGPAKVTEEDRNWWAYLPLQRPVVPEVRGSGWVRNPIDAFILHKLEQHKLSPAPPADKVALLRRAYYDLLGLPPTPEQVDRFLTDESPDAYESLIDELLQSPHYGEKWGRHWLDLVRFAETNGYERDGRKENVWKYRDYVIQSLNQDKPYDRFVVEQLAGDELPDANAESITATGYYRLGLWDDEPVDREQAFFDGLDDVVSTTGQVFMGMTVGCARCHDHKIDPVPQSDYYKLLAYFRNLKHGNTQVPVGDAAEKEAHEKKLNENRQQMSQLQKQVDAYETRIIATFSNPEKDDIKLNRRLKEQLLRERRQDVLAGDDLKAYLQTKKDLDELKRVKLTPLTKALAAQENGRKVPETFVLVRGNAHVRGDRVEPGVPQVLPTVERTAPAAEPKSNSSGRRLALARWLTNPDNPLPGRVIANRVWQFHFGRGLAASSNDFGRVGAMPTHPELLDWLATEMIARGWRLKSMHKLIMMSNTYRMSSGANPDALEQDPQNQLFWRFNMRRLTAEEVRDSVLSVSGNLNVTMFGPSIYPPLPKAVLATASRPDKAWGKSSPEEAARRSVYVLVKRSVRPPMLANFDAPDPDSSCAVRFTTTVPTQSLGMLNGDFANRQADLLASRLKTEAPAGVPEQVRLAIRLTTSRDPDDNEIADDVEFIQALEADEGLSPEQALGHYCLMMLNTNEFMYLD